MSSNSPGKTKCSLRTGSGRVWPGKPGLARCNGGLEGGIRWLSVRHPKKLRHVQDIDREDWGALLPGGHQTQRGPLRGDAVFDFHRTCPL